MGVAVTAEQPGSHARKFLAAEWAKKARFATARRDALIREMRAEGASLRAIGAAVGLSHTAVAKICERAS